MWHTTETQEAEGKTKVPIFKRPNIVIAFVLAIFLTTVVALALPIIEQTHIHVIIADGQISDVWVETTRVSLVSTLILPPKKIGINTINITIPKTGESFQLKDLPNGEYVIVWVADGVPASGTYKIEVKLIQNDVIMDIFNLEVSF